MKITLLCSVLFLSTYFFSEVFAQEATAESTGNNKQNYEIKAGSSPSNGIPRNGGSVIINSGSGNYQNSSGNLQIKTPGGFKSGDVNIETGGAAAPGGINLTAGVFRYSAYIQGSRLVSFALRDLERYSSANTPGLNFGIGTYTPKDKLHLDNLKNFQGLTFASKFKIRQSVISDNNFVMENIAPNGNLFLRSRIEGNTTGNIILNDKGGSVGIGTTSPSRTLDVNGDIQLSGSLYKNNLELNTNNLVTTKYRVNMHSGGFIHGVDSNGKPAGSNDSSYRELPEGITSGTYSWWNYGRTKGQPGSYGAAVGFGDGKRGSAEIWSGWTSGKLYTRFLRDCCQGWSDWNQIWTSNSDGENSGMDADTVDGLQPILEQKNGTVGIGTTDTKGYKLAVDGDIIAEEVKVQLSENWASVPDYVFKKSYDLATLAEVESYIEANGHLENIPSATEIEKAGGINVGEMNMKLLEKIEELTLYIISQNKQIAELKKDKEKVNNLERELKSIKELLFKLTQNQTSNKLSR